MYKQLSCLFYIIVLVYIIYSSVHCIIDLVFNLSIYTFSKEGEYVTRHAMLINSYLLTCTSCMLYIHYILYIHNLNIPFI